MIKISRPILYVALLAVVATVAVVLTEPEAPRKASPRSGKTKGASATKNEFLPEDRDARFDRIGAARRDTFRPLIVPSKRGIGLGAGPTGPVPGWVLTGLTVVDGVKAALMENPGTGDSAFLKAGALWNGIRVRVIESDSVLFERTDGTTVRCAFPAPEPPAPPSAPVVVTVPPAPGVPVAPSASAAPGAMDIPADSAARAGRRRNPQVNP
jgi:hypothetical protein